MSQAATTLTSTWLSDEAILGLEPSTSAATAPASGAISGPDGFADAADAALLSASNVAAATNAPRDSQSDASASANADPTTPTAESPTGREPRATDHDSSPTPRDTSVTIHALPAATLEQLDAAYYSPEPAARAQFAQSLFSSDPASFRAMFNEAARLLGVTVPTAEETRAEINSAPTTAKTIRPDAQGVSAVGAELASARSTAPQSQLSAANSPAAAGEVNVAPGLSPASPSATNHESRTTSHDSAAPAFPAAQYRNFEQATNAALSQEVRTAITATLDHALPEGTAPGAARRIADDIFTDIGQHLASDAQLSSQVGEVLRGWQFGPQEQQQVNALLTSRAKQLLPSAARRVIGEWSSNVLSTARTRAARSEASSSRVDVGNAASRPAAASEPARALKPKEINYARTSDDDILSM